MTNTGNKDIKFVLNRLEEILKENSMSGKVNENHSQFNKTLERSLEIVSNTKLLKQIHHYANAMTATCNLSMKNEKKVDLILMVNMLTLAIAKMEKDGLIKINV